MIQKGNLLKSMVSQDAMLLLFPLSVITRNEVASMSAASNFFISYKDLSPSMGLFQDSCIGAAEYTKEGVKLSKWHAMQAFSHINTTTERSVVFEKQMFTNREVISKILPKVNLSNKRPYLYKPSYAPFIDYKEEDICVEIDRGTLVQGILDKKTVGQGSNGSLFHVINNEYGPKKAMEVIYSMQQCITNFQLYSGFTVGIRDIIISDRATNKVKENTAKIIDDARAITQKLDNRKLYAPIGRTLDSFYEELEMNALNPGDDFVTLILEDIDFNSNGIAQLVFTGSKGKEPHIISISAAVGQQDVNGFRSPKLFGWKRTSPYFTRYDMEPKANGYISQSFKEGIPSETFMFIAQEARHGLINNALSTSVTGEQNRNAIKNLESLLTGCLRSLRKNNSIVQLLYGDTGLDPRKLVSVKFPTVLISNDQFVKNFKATLKDVASKYRNAKVDTILKEEFKILEADREEYRKIYFKVEKSDSSYLVSDSWISPVNVYKIIEDVVYNYKNLLKDNSLDPAATLKKVQKLCVVLPYAFMNSTQKANETVIPPHYISATKMLGILIRSHLCIKNLSKHKITDKLLDIIIEHIINKFTGSLIDYGMPMGIVAAQCISEPMTQFVLDSKHRSGIGGGSKTSTIVRVKEILGGKPTDKMKNPSMNLRVKEEFENNRVATQEIANHIEMLALNRFVSKVQIFFEEYNNPVHPDYKHEKFMISGFESRHRGIQLPRDLLSWCIRFELNRETMIFKSMTLETIVLALKKKFKELYLVFTPENSSVIIIRCYIRESLFKKSKTVKRGMDEFNHIIEYMHKIKQTIIRGVPNVMAADVFEYVKSIKDKDDSISTKKVFGIVTDGSNIKEILKVKGLDLTKCITDSIIEISNLLGIESGRASIINELRTTLEGISPIHCSVYSDEMCYPGIITSIEKTGLAIREYENILLRASYRYPIQTLEGASENGVTNMISGISAALCVGRPPNIGTTYSGTIVNQEFVKKYSKTLDEKLEEL